MGPLDNRNKNDGIGFATSMVIMIYLWYIYIYVCVFCYMHIYIYMCVYLFMERTSPGNIWRIILLYRDFPDLSDRINMAGGLRGWRGNSGINIMELPSGKLR